PFIEGALRGEPQRFERSIPDPLGGSSRHALAHYIPDTKDGVVRGFVALVHDVSQIHQLGEDLKERAAELTSLFQLLPIGVSALDAAGQVITMNKALASILGPTQPSLANGGLAPRSYVDRDGHQVASEQLPGALAIREQRAMGPTELGFTKADGSMAWVSMSAVPVVSRRAACIVATRDITQERSLQNSLERSNRRLRAILDAMPVPLAINDVAGNITYLNPAFTEVFGYTREDIPHLDAWWPRGYPNPAYRERVARDWSARLERARRDGHPFDPVEIEITTKGGATRIVIGSAAALGGTFDDEHLVVLFDITEKTRAEAFLRSVLDSALDGIITIDEEQRIVTFNGGAERMFGCAARMVIGGPLDLLIPDSLREKHASHVRAFGEEPSAARAMAPAIHRLPIERRRTVFGYRTSGEQFPISASISQVRIGERRYYTAVCRDITEQIREDKAREQLEGQLRHLQKLETMGSFASGIAHDFNNILTAILGMASMALESEVSDPELREQLTSILEATRRGAQLTRQLLSLSRPSVVEYRPLALDGVVQEVSKLLRAAAPRNIQIDLAFAPELPLVLGDAGQVHQVLLNLCSNAVHAMQQGGGRLTVSLDRWRGALAPGLTERDYVRMLVTDTGHGIPQEILPKIFEPFYTTKKSGEGSGLGLAVVRAIVEAHAGAISVESQIHGPTIFRVLWPTIDVPARPLAVVSKQREAKILFIDDDALACRVGEQILRGHGYRVTTFCEPEAAWAALAAAPTAFDVVVTDLSMPKLTGLELAQRMQRAGYELPVVLCTGNPGTLTTPTLLAAGIRELLLKPLTGRELLDAVARALGRRYPAMDSAVVANA
ncbi:MAG TPA: PAS domain S-box protein, partial [Pseudomonadota bacterium]|nr:PAS domain S-box protein [Pseudomonadota bacterium]